MQSDGGHRGSGGHGQQLEAEPPTWRLAAGCAAMVLLIAGLVAGGPAGGLLAASGCLTVLTLATVFFSPLALQQIRQWSG